jgi:hypothetical protein
MFETAKPRELGVFINGPFDSAYAPILDAIAFTVTVCGLKARCGLEVSDSGELRLQKILRLLQASRFSIHDLCRVELDSDSALPRFNMPIELGIALGMKHLGHEAVRDHAMLVLDSEPYRYIRFASDLAGVDIAAHGNTPELAIRVTRNFLAPFFVGLPDGATIYLLYNSFEDTLPDMAAAARQSVASLTFVDRLRHIESFVTALGPEN